MKKRRIILFLLIGFIFSGVYAQKIEWKEKAKLPQPMRGAAVSCNNNIYFMEAHSKVSGVYEYNVVEDIWKKTTNMITRGWNVNLVEIDGLIYAIGGAGGAGKPLDRLEAYNPLNNTWNVLAPMPTGRQHNTSCVVNDKIYVMGGIAKSNRTNKIVKTENNEVYNPKSNSWQTLSPLPTPCGDPIISAVGNNIYVLCGDVLWMYDTLSDIWETKKNCPVWISILLGSAVINDKIIFPGGQNKDEKAVSSVYIYNTTNDTWIKSTNLPKPIQIGGIATLSGKIYMIGGNDTDFNKYDTVYEGTLVD
ncbi:Kelch repeat-containing protein [Aquimarina macrocephali]|uniref:Kelch repeat-containing protein n=1 Tax=Aquimarina macrocephali TaxID=666563 RepID=UPI003F6779E7